MEDLYIEQDVRGMTPLPQMTMTHILQQIKRLGVVANSRFALGGWNGDHKQRVSGNGGEEP
jgi:hypothetical protein